MLKNTRTSYGSVAKGFHWLLFLMLAVAIIAGNLLAAIPNGPEKLEMAGTHKSIGLLILALVLSRLIWRLISTTPDDPQGTSKTQSLMAISMHWVLYILMFAQPLSGILMSQTAGIPVGFFGLWEVPTLLDKEQSLAKLFRSIHGAVWIVLISAVVGHVGAALYHHFVKKDDVLKRMTPLGARHEQ